MIDNTAKGENVPKAPTRLLGIDALRGIAALLVLVYHSRAIPWIGMGAFFKLHHSWSWNPDVWLGWALTPFRFGFLGVQLLFVLSGYCIHRSQAKALAAGNDGKIDLAWYAFRRFFRIYPTYLCALAFNGLLLYVLIPWLASRGFPNTVESHHSWYVFGMNLLTMQNILVPPYEGVFWSLSIEVHLYIAYPLLLWITRKFGPERMLLASLAGTIAYILAFFLFGANPAAAQGMLFVHFLFYWFTWAAGAYVAEMQFGRAKGFRFLRWTWPLFLAVGALLYFFATEPSTARYIDRVQAHLPRFHFDATQVMGAGEISLAVAVATLLAASLRPSADRLWTGFFGRFCAAIGLFSYSLYAIHTTTLQLFTVVAGGKTQSMAFCLFGCVCAIIIAYVFFNIVERWTLTPPKRWTFDKAAITKLPVETVSEPTSFGS